MFNLYENYSDVRVYKGKSIYPGCSLDVRDLEPRLLKSFNNLESALSELKNYSTDVTFLHSTSEFKVYAVTEYYIENSTISDIIKISE